MKTFEEYRSELDVPNLLMSGNCCRHAFDAGQESRQGEVDELQGRIEKALNLIYSEKGNAERGAHSKEVSDFVFGFGYELHLILNGEK